MEATESDAKQREYGEFDLPGFRFYPTEEELLGFYLKKRVQGHKFSFDIIRTLDLYRYDPWELPGMANHRGEREWFFFVPRRSKCPAPRRSRLTASGYWKATGSERALRNQALQCIGLKKTLVFYTGKAPLGNRTDWIMNEYRLPEPHCSSSFEEDVVLCRIYRKATPHKTLEQRATMAYHHHHVQPQHGGECSVEEMQPSQRLNSITESEVSALNSDHDNGSSMDEGQSSINTSAVEGQMEFGMNSTWRENRLKSLEVEVPKFSVDGFLSQPIVGPWGTENTWTPSIMLSTPEEWIWDGTITTPKVEMP